MWMSALGRSCLMAMLLYSDDRDGDHTLSTRCSLLSARRRDQCVIFLERVRAVRGGAAERTRAGEYQLLSPLVLRASTRIGWTCLVSMSVCVVCVIRSESLLRGVVSRTQDVDQYHTGFGEWKSQLYSRLGVDKAHRAVRGYFLSLVSGSQSKVVGL